jgi:hypothetical protein
MMFVSSGTAQLGKGIKTAGVQPVLSLKGSRTSYNQRRYRHKLVQFVSPSLSEIGLI